MRTKRVFVQKGLQIIEIVTRKSNGKYKVDTYKLVRTSDNEELSSVSSEYYENNGYNRLYEEE